MSERIVLIFAYDFPPENTIGAARPYRFYKYLSRMGYRCFVITAADQTTGQNPDIKYVPDPFTQRRGEGIGWQLERAIRKFLSPGAIGLQWSLLACRVARALLRSHPNSEITIFSTFPPLGAHLAAFLLARATKSKWIADFRDPLHNNPAVSVTRFQQKVNGWLQRLFLERAAVVVANTDTMTETWKGSYPEVRDRIHLIWNGFDPEDRIDACPLPVRDFKLISHVGELYGTRNVAPILESISRLIDAGRLKAGSIRIRLVGPMESSCLPNAAFVRQASQQGWLEIIPEQVPPAEARRIAQTSDALLLVQPHSTVQVPGKLFEYLRLGRPILAYLLPGTPSERILKNSGVRYSCVYTGSSTEDMDTAMEHFFRGKMDTTAPNLWFEQNFNAKSQSEALHGLIRSIHSTPGEMHERCVHSNPTKE